MGEIVGSLRETKRDTKYRERHLNKAEKSRAELATLIPSVLRAFSKVPTTEQTCQIILGNSPEPQTLVLVGKPWAINMDRKGRVDHPTRCILTADGRILEYSVPSSNGRPAAMRPTQAPISLVDISEEPLQRLSRHIEALSDQRDAARAVRRRELRHQFSRALTLAWLRGADSEVPSDSSQLAQRGTVASAAEPPSFEDQLLQQLASPGAATPPHHVPSPNAEE